MSKLIALVATAVMVGGERTIVQPGEELPELTAHDQRELVQAGMAENTVDTAALAKADARAKAKAEAEFEATRRAVQQAHASAGAPAARQDATATATATATEADKPAGKAAAARK